LYTTMILAWSITEIIRYGFYECALLGVDIPLLTWARSVSPRRFCHVLIKRYNLFMILYPIGASSEAFLSLSTLPPLSTLSLEAITSSLNPLSLVLRYLPNSLRSSLIKTSIGKHALWSMARASVKRKGKDYWGFIEVARLVLFVIWWPGESRRVR
jgi:very-long-chain (3R)-3-hydroxyacyl-CoA dehydratase